MQFVLKKRQDVLRLIEVVHAASMRKVQEDYPTSSPGLAMHESRFHLERSEAEVKETMAIWYQAYQASYLETMNQLHPQIQYPWRMQRIVNELRLFDYPFNYFIKPV